jgi:glycerate 2-kinase
VAQPLNSSVSETARIAKKLALPVITLAGTVGKGSRASFDAGIDAFASILRRPCRLDEAIENAEQLLTRASEDAIRMVQVGLRLGESVARREREELLAA